ncbi:MAG: carboxypeptidase-like regulatory domain-containing protein [Bryobacteraceae bacterium]|nr:carboxypeptidase-like regulatory domain-containing protein [Bryobacteraceae bacterium]
MRIGWIAAAAVLGAALWAGAALTANWRHSKVPAAEDGWCSIEGRIVSSMDGRPLRKVRLVLRRQGGSRAERLEALTDSAGKFRFERLLPGDYQLTARRMGYLSAVSDASAPAGAQSVRLKAGEHVRNLQMRLAPASQIRGMVLDPDDKPVPQARVLIFRLNRAGESEEPVRLARADSEGKFQAGMLRPGEYRLTALPQGSAVPSLRTWQAPSPGGSQHFWRSRNRAAFLAVEDVVVDLQPGEDLSEVKVLLMPRAPAAYAMLASLALKQPCPPRAEPW